MSYQHSIDQAQPNYANMPSKSIRSWVIVGLGLAILIVPMYWSLAGTLWQDESQIHAPIIAMVTAYIFWLKRKAFTDLESKPRPVLGGICLFIGLCLYIIGRSQSLPLFDVGAQIPILVGIVLCMHGLRLLKALWFPLFFLFFMIPQPGFVLDVVTQPLKQFVSQWAEILLYHAGYPIARSVVVLSIGSYQLLVADACSGMNAMFSLGAMGLLYLYLMHHSSVWRNTILIASILPMAFLANLVRVVALVLITYYFGDEVAQGYLHGSAGMVLFIAGLLILIGLDFLLGRLWPDPKQDLRHVQP